MQYQHHVSCHQLTAISVVQGEPVGSDEFQCAADDEWSGGTSNDLYTFFYVCNLVTIQNWPVTEYVFTVTAFFVCKSVVQIRRHFMLNFNAETCPSTYTWHKFKESGIRGTGSIHNTSVVLGVDFHSYPPKSIERVRNAMQQSATHSARWYVIASQIPNTSCQHILWNYLHLLMGQ